MNNSSIKEAYSYYKNNTRSSEKINLSDYRKLMNSFNTFLMKKILEGNEITLPHRLGKISIQGIHQNIRLDEQGNIKGTRIDWFSTKDLWSKNPEHAKKRL